VRVFSVDENSRSIIFTKKDTFMKEDAENCDGDISKIKRGAKVMGFVVGETSYGYVVKSFGNIKGLLTFADIKTQKLATGPYKEGQILKTYCLFNKKNSGLALTLTKRSAKNPPAPVLSPSKATYPTLKLPKSSRLLTSL